MSELEGQEPGQGDELAPIVPLRPKPAPERTYCSTCNHVLKPFYVHCPKCQGDTNRRHVDRLAAVIRELKDSIHDDIDPDRERELVKMLELYEHPEPKGFLAWLADAREKARQSPRGKGRR